MVFLRATEAIIVLIFCYIKTTSTNKTIICKQKISVEDFNYFLQYISWSNILNNNTNKGYENFLKRLSEIYNDFFPEMKNKNLSETIKVLS